VCIINLKGLPEVAPVPAVSDVQLNVVRPVEIDFCLLAKLRHFNLDLLLLKGAPSISLSYDEVMIPSSQVATCIYSSTSILETSINKLER
jgi:hypothetical protein